VFQNIKSVFNAGDTGEEGSSLGHTIVQDLPDGEVD